MNTVSFIIWYLFGVLLISIYSVNTQIDNSSNDISCSANYTTSGICRPLEDCSTARRVSKKGKTLSNCTETGLEHLVCCPMKRNRALRLNLKSLSCSANYTTLGTCRPLENCRTAGKVLETGETLENCTGEGSENLVCCPPKTRIRAVRLHLKKCKEYGRKVFVWKRPQILLVNAPKVNKSQCAFVAKPLIVGGEKAAAKEFPHMALIGYGTEEKKTWNCGGSLISESFVLTAAHCTYYDAYGEAKFVRLGDLNKVRTDDLVETQEFTIISQIKHPDYLPPSYYHDLALMKLDKNAVINEFVRPICLYGKKITPPRFIATGWGSIGYGDVTSDDLLKVTLDNYAVDKCNISYKITSLRKMSNGILPESQICASGDEQDTCQGDSGGPLQIYHDKTYCMYYIVGVTSFGKACGIGKSPGVYTRVSAYIPWIVKEVWQK